MVWLVDVLGHERVALANVHRATSSTLAIDDLAPGLGFHPCTETLLADLLDSADSSGVVHLKALAQCVEWSVFALRRAGQSSGNHPRMPVGVAPGLREGPIATLEVSLRGFSGPLARIDPADWCSMPIHSVGFGAIVRVFPQPSDRDPVAVGRGV